MEIINFIYSRSKKSKTNRMPAGDYGTLESERDKNDMVRLLAMGVVVVAIIVCIIAFVYFIKMRSPQGFSTYPSYVKVPAVVSSPFMQQMYQNM